MSCCRRGSSAEAGGGGGGAGVRGGAAEAGGGEAAARAGGVGARAAGAPGPAARGQSLQLASTANTYCMGVSLCAAVTPCDIVELLKHFLQDVKQSSPPPAEQVAGAPAESTAGAPQIDPVMAKYMQMVQEQKDKEKAVRLSCCENTAILSSSYYA